MSVPQPSVARTPARIVRSHTQLVRDHAAGMQRLQDQYFAALKRAEAQYFDGVRRMTEGLTQETAPVEAEPAVS